jgi:hypothetical protein
VKEPTAPQHTMTFEVASLFPHYSHPPWIIHHCPPVHFNLA